MISFNDKTTKDKQLSRQQVFDIIRTALQVKEYNFGRRLASAWLETYPGDLGIHLLHAMVLSKENKLERSFKILEVLTEIDPEFLAAQSLFGKVAAKLARPEVEIAQASVVALGGKKANGVDVPSWGKSLRQADFLIAKKQYTKAESKIQAARLAQPNSPLPAVFHLKLATIHYEWRAINDLVEMYTGNYPNTLAFKLAQANLMMDSGDDQAAVALLHECVSADINGQVAHKFLGAGHDYRSLWPSTLEITQEIQIPAAVSSELGSNHLAFDESATRSKSQNFNGNSHSHKKREPELLLSIKDELKKIANRLRKPHIGRADGRYPVYVILTTRHGLVKQYGGDNFDAIDIALQDISKATAELPKWNALISYADDADNAAELGVTPAKPNDPWAIKKYLIDLDEALRRSGRMIGALLIVGGDEVVPFHKLPNPVDDLDTEVPSDNPYSTLDDDYFISSWPLGRIPGSAGDDPADLLKSLRHIVASRKNITKRRPWLIRFISAVLSFLRIRRKLTTNFGYSAQIWQRASHSVFRIIGERRALAISPPTFAEKLPKRAKQHLDLAYYNLHGIADSAEWYGQRDPIESKEGPDYPVALRPQDVVNSGRAPQIVFTEACYGANIHRKTVETALSLKFLSAGSKVVVGSTCTSYGSIASPLIAADLLGQSFWKLLKEGFPAGEALRRAKIYLAREMHQRQGYLDGEDQKTLIQFVLYGDPLAQPDTQSHHPVSYQRYTNPKVKTICDKVNGKSLIQDSTQDELVKQVKGLVKEYLPGMAKSKVVISQEHVDCVGHNCPTQQMGDSGHPTEAPRRRVVTLSKQVQFDFKEHPQYARVTFDEKGKVVKLAVSR